MYACLIWMVDSLLIIDRLGDDREVVLMWGDEGGGFVMCVTISNLIDWRVLTNFFL